MIFNNDIHKVLPCRNSQHLLSELFLCDFNFKWNAGELNTIPIWPSQICAGTQKCAQPNAFVEKKVGAMHSICQSPSITSIGHTLSLLKDLMANTSACVRNFPSDCQAIRTGTVDNWVKVTECLHSTGPAKGNDRNTQMAPGEDALVCHMRRHDPASSK